MSHNLPSWLVHVISDMTYPTGYVISQMTYLHVHDYVISHMAHPAG